MHTKKTSLASQSSSNEHEENVKVLLRLLKDSFDEMSRDAAQGREMFELGILTEIGKKADDLVRAPHIALFDTYKDLNLSIKKLVVKLLYGYFGHKKSDLDQVHLLDTQDNTLFYYIVMKNDVPDSRDKFFEFFDYYDKLPLSEQFPVHFQFTPKNLVGELEHVERVNFG